MPFMDEATEAQGSKVICLRSQGQLVAELDLQPGLCDSRAWLSNTGQWLRDTWREGFWLEDEALLSSLPRGTPSVSHGSWLSGSGQNTLEHCCRSVQLYPKAQEKTKGAAGGPDRPGWARAPGIPAASAGSRMGRKPALASSPRILWAAQPGRTEALFVPAPARHPRLDQGFEFPGGWGHRHC